ncbi:hypothetical protein Hanom_Chr09g00841141 [Helianthus anomalus]
MKDFQESKWINVGVVNCFASMLNHDENEGTNEIDIYTMLFDFWWVQAEDMLLNKKYGDSQRVEKLRSASLLVV